MSSNLSVKQLYKELGQKPEKPKKSTARPQTPKIDTSKNTKLRVKKFFISSYPFGIQRGNPICVPKTSLKMASQETIPSFYECSLLLGEFCV